MRDPWLVVAKTHDGQPWGSTRVDGQEAADRAAARYMEHPKVGSVSATRVRPYPMIARGNGRYR